MSGGRSLPWRRSVQRGVHLVLAVALGVFVYAPVGSTPLAVLLVQTVVFPALAVSGLLMWKGGQLRRRLQTRRAA